MKPTSTHGVRPRPRATRRTVLSVLAASLTLVGAAACDRGSSTGASPVPERGGQGRHADDHVQLHRGRQERRRGRLVREVRHPDLHEAAEGQGRQRHGDLPAVRGRRRAVQDQGRPRPQEPAPAPTSWPSTASGSASSPRPATSSRSPTSAGPGSTSWDGWSQIPKAVQGNASFEGKAYGIPAAPTAASSTSTRSCSRRPGCPPTGSRSLAGHHRRRRRSSRRSTGVDPIQINAGTAMGEATTMQGVLPLLVGTGRRDLRRRQVAGRHPGHARGARLLQADLDQGLGDPELQQAAKGRDKSFAAFADGKVGILLEGDYFWRSVINPDNGRRADGRP